MVAINGHITFADRVYAVMPPVQIPNVLWYWVQPKKNDLIKDIMFLNKCKQRQLLHGMEVSEMRCS